MMKLLPLVFLSMLPLVHGADDGEKKPGFLQRVWRSTRDGAGRTWDATRKAGQKVADVAKSPFRRGGKGDSEEQAVWRRLVMTMRLEPPVVKAGETRTIDVIVGVSNKGKEAVRLDFPTSQRIDVLVKDAYGHVLSRWSDDQRVEKEPGSVLINPGERIEYPARISTREMRAGGSFTIEAFLPGYERLRVSRAVVPKS